MNKTFIFNHGIRMYSIDIEKIDDNRFKITNNEDEIIKNTEKIYTYREMKAILFLLNHINAEKHPEILGTNTNKKLFVDKYKVHKNDISMPFCGYLLKIYNNLIKNEEELI